MYFTEIFRLSINVEKLIKWLWGQTVVYIFTLAPSKICIEDYKLLMRISYRNVWQDSFVTEWVCLQTILWQGSFLTKWHTFFVTGIFWNQMILWQDSYLCQISLLTRWFCEGANWKEKTEFKALLRAFPAVRFVRSISSSKTSSPSPRSRWQSWRTKALAAATPDNTE